MVTKTVVDLYLSQNFKTIEANRQKSGFSWRPILVAINVTELDPESKAAREYVRKRFLEMRTKNKDWKSRTMDILEEEGKIAFKETIKTGPTNPTRATLIEFKEPEYSYLDTYNKPAETPKTEEDEYRLWKKDRDKLKNQKGMHIVLGCVHLPAVNKEFFDAFLKFMEDVKSSVRGIHLIGDILDCKSLSSHDMGQVSDTTLEIEYKESNKYLDLIDGVLPPNIEKNYLWGNHEERFSRIIKRVDMAKFGGALMSPTKGGRFVERGYTVQEDYKNAKIQLGKYLDLVHGEYIVSNAAKKHLDVYKKSIMFAHTHKIGTHFDCDKAAFNIGWMGNSEDSAFSYCSRITKSQWQNGFAVVQIDADGYYHVQTVQWYNGRFFFGGKEYK